MNLSDLPQFHIDHIETVHEVNEDTSDVTIQGTITSTTGLSEGRYWLYVSLEDSVIGDLSLEDGKPGGAKFIGLTRPSNPYLRVGATLPLLDGYWNANIVAFVLDPDLHWKKISFQSSDAIESREPGYRVLAKASSATEASNEVKVVQKGWDHEHCEICWNHISEEAPLAYVHENFWFCSTCYEKYLVPHDLAFLEQTQ